MRFLLFTFLSFTCLAQVHKLAHRGDSYFKVDEFEDALPYYLKLDSLQPNDSLYKYRIGICYFNSHFKSKSLAYFLEAQKLGYSDPEMDIFMGRAYHLNHKWDEAIQHYERFKNQKIDSALIKMKPDENEEIRENHLVEKNIERYIQMCRFGKQLMEDSMLLSIENIGSEINSSFPDYVPVVSLDQNTLIFTSRRNNTTGGKRDLDNKYFEDIYISQRDSVTGKWKHPENMDKHINSPMHDACIGLSPDGHKLFLYRSSPGKSRSGDILVSNLEGTSWSVPVLMGDNINSESWEPSASISIDEKTMFFSSDRPGGFGGTDIYFSSLQADGNWGTPVNMGSHINTPENEDAPYIHPDNRTLFFSSRGHQTMGGFDIFTTEFDEETKTWSSPENAGYPINTADDDIYFIWSADGTRGYFSSWREDSYGEKDLYVIHRPEATHNVMVLKGKVFDKVKRTPLGSTITIVDKETNELIGKYNSNSVTGKYAMVVPLNKKLEATFETDGFVTHQELIEVKKKNPFFEVKKDVYLTPLGVGATIVFNNIFFEYDKATLKNNSEKELNRMYEFLAQYPELWVEISGHTDFKGSEKYNQYLSERRAESVVAWLVNKGIAPHRLVSKGYGESRPIATNKTDTGRQLNRRTELMITDSEHKSVQKINGMDIRYQVEYYETASNTIGLKESQHFAIDTTQYEALLNTVLDPKIHFVENNSQTLTEYSTKKVLEVVAMMKHHPEMRIKVVAYGDHDGNDVYQKQISEQRAHTVYKMMQHYGIDKHRLQKEAFRRVDGISDPVLKAKKTRRVEFWVIN